MWWWWGGGSGLARGRRLQPGGAQTACITKGIPDALAYVSAQAAIAAALGNMGADDGAGTCTHRQGSDWLGDQDAIGISLPQRARAVYELEHWGLPSRAARRTQSISGRSAA